MDIENNKVDGEILEQFEECIFLNRLGLIYVGIWPLKRDASKFRLTLRQIHLFIVYFLIFLLLAMQWCDMYSLWGNIDANTETFMSNAFIFAVMMKYSYMLKSMHIFEEILQRMQSNWTNTMTEPIVSKENKEIMHRLSTRARDRSTKYGFVVFSAAIMYFIRPLVDSKSAHLRNRSYPFFGRYYIDRNSDLVYSLCYMSQVITGSIVGVANYATDTIFLVCTYHACAQLRILKNDLMDLGRDISNDSRDKVIDLIRRHQQEIRYAEALQSVFSGSSLQQLLVSCLMICVNGFKLIVSLSNRDIDFLMYVVCIPLTLFQILFYCQPGNELIVQSQSLNEAIYQSSWVNLDRGSIRHLIFMIQRSQKPLAITAGKIYVLSLQNFMKILKTSMSALSVLQAVYMKNN